MRRPRLPSNKSSDEWIIGCDALKNHHRVYRWNLMSHRRWSGQGARREAKNTTSAVCCFSFGRPQKTSHHHHRFHSQFWYSIRFFFSLYSARSPEYIIHLTSEGSIWDSIKSRMESVSTYTHNTTRRGTILRMICPARLGTFLFLYQSKALFIFLSSRKSRLSPSFFVSAIIRSHRSDSTASSSLVIHTSRLYVARRGSPCTDCSLFA